MTSMLGHHQPYSPEQVQVLFPILSEVECRIVSHIEHHHPGWAVWPHVDYPQVRAWYAARDNTPMQPLVTGQLGDVPGEILDWKYRHSSRSR